MRVYIEIGLAVAALLGSGLWLHARDGRMRAEGRAELLRASRDSAIAVADSASAHAEWLDSLTYATRARADSVREAARAAIDAARENRPEIVERIVVAPDTAATRAAVEELQASHREEVTALEDALAAADSLISAQARQIAGERAARARVQTALDAALAVGAETTGRGFVETWGERLLAVGVGAGIGYLAGGG